MRFAIPALGLAAVLATVSSVTHGQAARALDPRSVALAGQARAALEGGQLQAAVDLAETALAVDPRNRPAFRIEGEVALRQGLPGKAIRMYREALQLDGTDIDALAGQGAAFAAKGATDRAQQALAQIRKLCRGTCPQAELLSSAIARGPIAVAQATPAKPPAQ